MLFNRPFAIFFLMLLGLKAFPQEIGISAPSGLMCDFIEVSDNVTQLPLIANRNPAFSWEFNDKGKDVIQTGYQIIVSDNLQQLGHNVGDIWNSGKVRSPGSAGIVFDGKALRPRAKYYWKIKVWNSHGEESSYSRTMAFQMAERLSDYQGTAYPLRVTEQKPALFRKRGNSYQADFGRDAFGQLKLHLFSEKGGDTVTVRLGEVLDSGGNIDPKPPGTLRFARYVLVLDKGAGVYKIIPKKNNYNTRPAAIKMPDYIGEVTPFRYCEIEGAPKPVKAGDFTRLFVHYKFDDGASAFHSSDPTLNAVWDLCKYSIKATSFAGMYVDGDRERIPYEADAYINQLSHYAVDKEFTLARKSHEYLIKHPTWPTEWILQSVLIAWNDYLYSGDLRSARYYYSDLQCKTLDALSDSTGLISTLNGKLTGEVKASIHFSGDLRDIVDWPHGSETDGFVFTKYNAVVNAFYYRSLVIMEKIARDLGKLQDAEMYRNKHLLVKSAFQKMFFDKGRGIYLDGNGTDHASLHANVFALALGLVDAGHQNTVVAFIRSRGMACSVYGSQFLLDAVYDSGEGGYGLSLLTSKTDRSWYNMLRVGSTITLEAWDNKYKPNQDWNHAWGAAPANIISRKLMGIEPLTPGWAKFRIRPRIGGLKYADITVPTVKGPVKVSYKQERSCFKADVEIPANTSAQFFLPLNGRKNYQVLLNGKNVKATSVNGAAMIGHLGSGIHRVRILYLN